MRKLGLVCGAVRDSPANTLAIGNAANVPPKSQNGDWKPTGLLASGLARAGQYCPAINKRYNFKGIRKHLIP